MKNLIITLFVLLFVSACGSRQVKLLDATWVSMKNGMPPDPKDNLVRVNHVSEEYCMTSWSGSFGLMDEAVKKVESKYQVDYIKYPSFIQEYGTNCVTVSGEGYKINK